MPTLLKTRIKCTSCVQSALVVHPGLLQDVELRQFHRPVTGSRFDPMHCMYANGLFSHELGRWLSAGKKQKPVGIRFAHLDAFINADWKCGFTDSKHFQKRRDAFSSKREAAFAKRKDDGVKMMASDCLTLYPLLRRFAEIYGMGDAMVDHTKAVLALLDVSDVLQQAKKQQLSCSRETMAKLIRDLVARYLQVRMAVYGPDDAIPKEHHTRHIWRQFLEDGLVLDCWVLERMHLLIKAFANEMLNTNKFEKTVISRAVIERTRQLQRCSDHDRLVGPQVHGHAKQLCTHGGQCFHVEDLVFPFGNFSRCCIVKACFGGREFGLVLPGSCLICWRVVVPSRVDAC